MIKIPPEESGEIFFFKKSKFLYYVACQSNEPFKLRNADTHEAGRTLGGKWSKSRGTQIKISIGWWDTVIAFGLFPNSTR